MTNKDIFVQVLSELTGRPQSTFSTVVDKMQAAFPGGDHWDEEVSEAEAQALLAELREEHEGILAWARGEGLP